MQRAVAAIDTRLDVGPAQKNGPRSLGSGPVTYLAYGTSRTTRGHQRYAGAGRWFLRTTTSTEADLRQLPPFVPAMIRSDIGTLPATHPAGEHGFQVGQAHRI